jgi:DNA-binding Lrp family transcriptional regulator
MDAVDNAIINGLQGDFPLSDRPYADAAMRFGITEEQLIERIKKMLANGLLTRFGPLYNAERLGGGLTLAAMPVPATDFDRVADLLDAMPEVAHNYARDHDLNMWFVLATETPERIDEVLVEIRERTGYPLYNMPKIEEFFVGLRFEL